MKVEIDKILETTVERWSNAKDKGVKVRRWYFVLLVDGQKFKSKLYVSREAAENAAAGMCSRLVHLKAN
jgi:5,10-methylene-tetrahydrofolate dehydrogenase/methenyl tetrahydrofolate cyclohydrolase